MTHVTIQHLPDDPMCLRISIGGIEEKGFYCVFRGNQDEVISALEKVLLVLKHAPPLPIERDDRRILWGN
jgi:hypothetical protein